MTLETTFRRMVDTQHIRLAILAHLRAVHPERETCREISTAIGQRRFDVQCALLQLDDSGRVAMRNGFYRLSEAELAKEGKA